MSMCDLLIACMAQRVGSVWFDRGGWVAVHMQQGMSGAVKSRMKSRVRLVSLKGL